MEITQYNKSPSKQVSLHNHTVKLGVTSRMSPLRRSRSLKVTDFGTNRKFIYNFLLVINTNLPPILHRFQVMANYWSNFC